MLAANSTLTTLRLGGCGITNERVGHIARALTTNSTLTSLYLDLNDITINSKEQNASSQCWHANSTLTSFERAGNISASLMNEIKQLLESTKSHRATQH